MENEIKEMFGLILNKLGNIEVRLDRIESRLDSLESRVDHLESRQDEIYLVVKAIEHNQQVHRAEIDNLRHSVANVEGTINAIGEVITKRKAI
ncbi:hypothetical protein [Desulfosporosinus meridiei]|uniref:Uncharacterized protein family (UPF0184) n=1 Tax=Desulfosporosinus meridiei (strain ATCC BAA-275 / DSM 13257 / KCTC 12902 / NCIMB 13706 / S10) TaxID=768704 RepID=J7J4A8_DESMD|nr:hypothetical protein [Desulfosporosinus meridiei]AFQ46113.1 Uncharacterized protein family (UPF0184) [Desulfosporosinus meridiei DSM 13257]